MQTVQHDNDPLMIGGHTFTSRFILSSGKYSLKLIEAAVRDAEAELITLTVRRANTREHENILGYILQGVTLLPNTSGVRNAEEAARIARLARELGYDDFVKIKIMRDSGYLLPDNQGTIRAMGTLAKEGFVVISYTYPDLNATRDLVNTGTAAVMPLASPIDSNKGPATREFIQILIDEIDLPVVVDADIDRSSQTCGAMEMGAAAIMASTTLATTGDLPLMASAFRKAIETGRQAYLSGLGRMLVRGATTSDPLTGFLRNWEGVWDMGSQFFVGSEYLSPEALSRKHQLKTDSASCTDHMAYLPGMERIQSDVVDKIMTQMSVYEPDRYTARDVETALTHETCSIEDFKALLSPTAEPYLERAVQWARLETRKHFGNTVYLFIPLCIANYCENYCIYCDFSCYNHIKCMKLNAE